MFKSLFAKYISIFISIVFVGFLILTLVMTYFVGTFSTTVKYDNLSHIASSAAFFVVNNQEHPTAANQLDIEYNAEFKKVVEILSSDMDEMSVFVTNSDGTLLAFKSSKNLPEEDFFTFFDSGVILDEEDLSELKSGKKVRNTGSLNGILKDFRTTVGVPVFCDDEYCGAVFASTLDTRTDSFVETMMMTLIMASLCIMLVCMLAVYVISVRLTNPLRDMNIAAKEFAMGKFDRTIPVKGNDEISQLASAFNDMAKSLKDLDYMRSSFVSSVSHELRTPMTTIGGFIDSILDGVIPPEEERHYLELISNEIKRLSRLVTSLLEISRIESGQKKLNYSTFDICELARIILISNEQRLEAKELDVSFKCDKEHIDVIADKDSIHQVLFNICDNAIKFSREGGKYEISLREKGDKVEISVLNEGEGIPEEDLPRIFDRFYKSDKSRGLDKSGVGLGLFIVKSIITSHGETIRAESEQGKWCRFVFTLQKANRSGKK